MATFMVTHSGIKMPLEQFKAHVKEVCCAESGCELCTNYWNASEGKLVCVFEAPGKEALVKYLSKKGVSYDSIMTVEYVGAEGKVKQVSGCCEPTCGPSTCK